VGVGTSLFYDPLVCRKINAGIADYLAQNRMASVAELVGTLDAPKKTVQACAC
jgi:dihydroorotate dehydrogenase (NAD+) catalytic subunit